MDSRSHLRIAPLLALLLVACAPELTETGPGGNCASCDEGALPTPILGQDSEWYRCWVDEDTDETDDFFRQDYVFCEMTPQGRDLELQYVSVQLFTAEDGVSEVLLDADEPLKLVRKVNGPAYPLELRTSVHLTNYNADINYSGIVDDYATTHELARESLPTKDAPLIVTQPFDLWPVEVIVVARNVSLAFDSYPVQLSGLEATNGSVVDVGVRNQSVGREGDVMRFYLPVTSGTTEAAFAGSGQFYRDTLSFIVEGAGRYLADVDGLIAYQ